MDATHHDSETQVVQATREPCLDFSSIRSAQQRWAETSIPNRLSIVARLRHAIANNGKQLAEAVELPQRDHLSDSLAAEVIPLADACRFLERNAKRLLAIKKCDRRDRPAWGRGLVVQTHREPLGIVLVIGTWNYPLFLTGVQTIQAIVAGNGVLLKPGAGTTRVIALMRRLFIEAGLPADLLQVLPESPVAAQQAIRQGVDKVVFTGSAAVGKQVLAQLAESATPSVMELSGSDACFVLPSADMDRAARCIAFGLRINGSSTCIAPRRVFVERSMLPEFRTKLLDNIRDKQAYPVHPVAGQMAARLIENAVSGGAKLLRPLDWNGWHPGEPFPVTALEIPVTELEVEQGRFEILRSDVFAPVVTLVSVSRIEQSLPLDAACPYALGATVFGFESEAIAFAKRVDAGCVVINDMVAPTADPRVSFGGRHASGFGVTRGAEGLLELTQIKSIVKQRSNWLPHLDKSIPELNELLLGFLKMNHGATLKEKWQAMRELMSSGRAYWMAKKKHDEEKNRELDNK